MCSLIAHRNDLQFDGDEVKKEKRNVMQRRLDHEVLELGTRLKALVGSFLTKKKKA